MKRKKRIIPKVIFIIVLFACSRFMYHKYNDAYGTIYGTVIDKTEMIVTHSLLIHPNDNRLKDFEVKCPSFIYAKYDVGKKVVFDRVNVYEKLKEEEQRWYDEPNLCAIFSICFFYIAFYSLSICYCILESSPLVLN